MVLLNLNTSPPVIFCLGEYSLKYKEPGALKLKNTHTNSLSKNALTSSWNVSMARSWEGSNSEKPNLADFSHVLQTFLAFATMNF